jgi:salicylate hydroxylase
LKTIHNPPELKKRAITSAKVPLKVVIVGAGLGGLATSIALARRGHKVVVLEQATQLGEVTCFGQIIDV